MELLKEFEMIDEDVNGPDEKDAEPTNDDDNQDPTLPLPGAGSSPGVEQ